MKKDMDFVTLDDKFLQKLNSAREVGKKIGLVQGSWDLYHIGHLRYIEKAKELCDFLIVGIDSDEKIRKRKGPRRPIWPLEERKEMITKQKFTDGVVVKGANEPKWGLIKTIRPDVLIAIKDNYTDEEIKELEEFCGKVAVLPRQAEKSTSDLIRQMMILNRENSSVSIDEKMNEVIQKIKLRNAISEIMPEPLGLLFENLKESTDWIYPVAIGCYLNGKWHFGTNQIDPRLPKSDIEKRTEFFYSTVEQAALNMLKKLGDVGMLNVPVWTTLFPGDRSIKALYNKGVKEIYYLEDHPERNWSKRSHELARKYGIKTTKITDLLNVKVDEDLKCNLKEYNERKIGVIKTMKLRLGLSEVINEPLSIMFKNLNKSTDWDYPVSACCFYNGKWYFGTSKIDPRLSKSDMEYRTKLFYATLEHAEINLLKNLGNVEVLDIPVWTTLFPSNKCMKVLHDKGIKEIYYLEDHPEQEWSKQAHESAQKYGIKTTKITELLDIKIEKVKPEIIKPETIVSDDLIKFDEGISTAVEKMKSRLGLSGVINEPISLLFESLKNSTEFKVPVSACCFYNGKWYTGTNKIDMSLPRYDIVNRTELFYATTEHAEINLLKQLRNVEVLNTPIWVTLFPCDICMEVLINKGVKEIYYLEDHPERNWSKRSHEKALKHGIKTINIMEVFKEKDMLDKMVEKDEAGLMIEKSYEFIDPRNVRHKEQLNIMLQMENEGKDPLDPNFIQQEILFQTDFWYVSRNRFPYEEIEYQFLITSQYPIYKIDDMTKEMWIDLRKIWKKLISEYKIQGGALCYRFGETFYSGASLKRLHCHLIMPKKGYKTKFTIGGNVDSSKVLCLKNYQQHNKN